MSRLVKILRSILIVFFLVGIAQSKAAYITKKSDTTKEIEKIEKAYADGSITKWECTKKKSKALKLEKVSKTICDNVKVKVDKKEESKEKKKVEYVKKKKKKEKKSKKEFLKKTKDLSKKAKSWITKKIKKEKKHYKSIAKLPKSDFYFTATDDKGNIFIGYVKGDPNSKTMGVGNSKFKKVSDGQAFQNDAKTQCSVRSEVDEATNNLIYTGQLLVKCPNKVFIGIWHQTGNEGFGIAQSKAGTKLDFTFSTNRNDAVTSLNKKKKESKKVKKVAKIEKKNYESKDKELPVIKISYNKKWFSSKKHKEVNIESNDGKYIIQGVVNDKGGSIEETILLRDGRKVKTDEEGGFIIEGKSNKSLEIWLTAVDGGGNTGEFQVNITILSAAKKFLNTKKYYALIIGNKNYETWDDLDTPIKDVTAIAKVLEERYKFEVKLLKDAKKEQIIDAFWELNDKITEEDYLLIYYAGHGSKDTRIQKAYWIPTDARKIDEPGKYWLSTSIVTEHVGRIKAMHVLVIVDSCYSGLLRGDDNIKADIERDLENPLYFTKMLNRKARLYISSGGDAPVPDSIDGAHSLFAKKFIETLENNTSSIDSQEIYIKVKKYVQNNSSQNPRYLHIEDVGHNEGVFVFSAKN